MVARSRLVFLKRKMKRKLNRDRVDHRIHRALIHRVKHDAASKL